MNISHVRLMGLPAEHFRSNCASMYSIGPSANKVVSLAEYELGSKEWRADVPSSPKRESGEFPGRTEVFCSITPSFFYTRILPSHLSMR